MSRTFGSTAAVAAAAISTGCVHTGAVTAYAYARSTVPVLSAEKTATPDTALNDAVTKSHWVSNLDWGLHPEKLYAVARDNRDKLLKVRTQLGAFKDAVERARPWQLESSVARARAFHGVLVEQSVPFNACYFGDISRGDIVWPGEGEPTSDGSDRQDSSPPAEGSSAPSPTGLSVRADDDGDFIVSSEAKQSVMLDWSIRAQTSRSRVANSAKHAAYALVTADKAALEVLEHASQRCVQEYTQVDQLVGLFDAYLSRSQRPFVTVQVLNALEEPIIVLPLARGRNSTSFQRIEVHDGFAAKVSVPVPIAPKQYAEVTFELLGDARTLDPATLRLEYLSPGRKGLEHRGIWLEAPDPEAGAAEE